MYILNISTETCEKAVDLFFVSSDTLEFKAVAEGLAVPSTSASQAHGAPRSVSAVNCADSIW